MVLLSSRGKEAAAGGGYNELNWSGSGAAADKLGRRDNITTNAELRHSGQKISSDLEKIFVKTDTQ